MFVALMPCNAELVESVVRRFRELFLTGMIDMPPEHRRNGGSTPAYVTAGDGFTCFGVWLEMSEESAPSESTPKLGTPR